MDDPDRTRTYDGTRATEVDQYPIIRGTYLYCYELIGIILES